jgi:flagellar P-ring protein precursor FlgI
MKLLLLPLLLLAAALGSAAVAEEAPPQVRLKDLGRVDGWRDNSLVGYGLVIGLAGSGDSLRNRATRQSIANVLSQFGIYLPVEQVQSRNVAAVMVMATLTPYAREGNKIDVNVSSMGDARSLLGGTLLLTPLKAPNGRVYALAQGPLSVGGYKYDLFGNLVQKNHPTVGRVPGGAVIEENVSTFDGSERGSVVFLLADPDYTTASNVAESVNRAFGRRLARARDASSVEIALPGKESGEDAVAFLKNVENVPVEPGQRARVVINERTGMVVSGGDVRISQAAISHGDLKVSITTDYIVSQPNAPFYGTAGPNARTVVVPQTSIDVKEEDTQSVSLPGNNNTVSDLAKALAKIRTSPRDMISILQGLRTAGALHAELIIQ